jgi:dTDP-4-dehydrorhamnose 3,5-epimerase
MTFEETPLKGAYMVRRERSADGRGAFERLWCARELEDRGLNGRLAQASLSTNGRRGTLRGMHYQTCPGMEEKLVTCLRGSLYDVIVDVREGSPTVGRWFGMRLSADAPVALYVPKGFAHGFVTLEDDTAILYQITEFYDPALAAGFRWNDPTFAIGWPLAPEVVSDRDRAFPDFAPVPGARPCN